MWKHHQASTLFNVRSPSFTAKWQTRHSRFSMFFEYIPSIEALTTVPFLIVFVGYRSKWRWRALQVGIPEVLGVPTGWVGGNFILVGLRCEALAQWSLWWNSYEIWDCVVSCRDILHSCLSTVIMRYVCYWFSFLVVFCAWPVSDACNET
jgi:hypothetical protein